MKSLEETAQAREVNNNAVARLEKRQITVKGEYHTALSSLADSLVMWAKGTLTEDGLKEAYSQTSVLKEIADSEPFRLANELLKAEWSQIAKVNNQLIIEKDERLKAAKFRELFNAAVIRGTELSRQEEVELKRNMLNKHSAVYQLDCALKDYTFRYKGHPSPPTFQDFSKIELFPCDDDTTTPPTKEI